MIMWLKIFPGENALRYKRMLLMGALIWSQTAVAQPDNQPESAALSAAELQRLQSELLQLGQTSEVFDPRMGELSLALARHYIEQGLHEDALQAIYEADQNLKINLGLYAPEREPLLRLAFERQVALQDIEAAEDQLGEIAWLSARAVGVNAPGYLSRLKEQAAWHLSRYMVAEADESLKQLEKALEYLERARDIYQSSNLPYEVDFLDIYLAVNQEISQFVPTLQVSNSGLESIRSNRDRSRVERLIGDVCESGYIEDEDLASTCERAGEIELRRQRRMTTELDTYDPYDISVNHTALFVNRAYQRGREVIEEAYESSLVHNDPALQVTSLLKSADWHLFFDRDNTARDLYLAAAELVAEYGLDQQFDLGRPQPIPPNRLYSQLINLNFDAAEGSIRFAANIDERGYIDSIKAVEISLEDAAEAGRLASHLLETRFRPALNEGVAVGFEGYEFEAHY